MKYFSFLLVLFVSIPFWSSAQVADANDDFEGNSTIDSWLGDDCTINIDFDNPFQQGINTSNTVLEYNDYGGQYANVRFQLSEKFNLASRSKFSLKIFVPTDGLTGSQNNQISLKLQNGDLDAPWETQTEIIKSISLNEWQTVTFDFLSDNYINLDGSLVSPIQRTDFNRVVIQVNGENNNDLVRAFIDDFKYEENTTISDDPVFDYLVWSDEFDGEGALDDSKWFHQTRLPDGGSWFNGEIQHYTDRIGNTFMQDGNLNLVAKKEFYTDQGVSKNYTSARLNSKFAFQYGRVDIRAKLPSGVGTWPAIWMLGKNISENGAYWETQGFGNTGWPACGEIDIMEHWGDNQNFVQSAMHTPSSHGNTSNKGGQFISTASTEFHVYSLIWTDKKMTFSIDDVVHYIYDPEVKDASTWPFNAEQYLILNIAIQPFIDPAFTSSTMEVDYVRVYQESPLATVNEQTSKKVIAYPNPVDQTLTINLEEVRDQKVRLDIRSINGGLINTYNSGINNNQLTLDGLDALPTGIYFVVFEADGDNYSVKFVKI